MVLFLNASQWEILGTNYACALRRRVLHQTRASNEWREVLAGIRDHVLITLYGNLYHYS